MVVLTSRPYRLPLYRLRRNSVGHKTINITIACVLHRQSNNYFTLKYVVNCELEIIAMIIDSDFKTK